MSAELTENETDPTTVTWADLPDGRRVWVRMMLLGNYRVIIGDPEALYYDDSWCFREVSEAVMAATARDWDGTGDPPGRWHRHISTGRRREWSPDGELVREWVAQ